MEPLTNQTIYPVFSWEALIFVVVVLLVGVVLLGLELFVLPGFGIAGVLGLCGLIGGSVAAWVFLGPTWGALVVVATVAVAVLLLIVAMRTGVVKRRLVLDTKLERGKGTEAEELEALVGNEGTAHTDLRPAGIADLGEERVDVVSEGGFIESGTRIRVVAVDGPRVVVAPADE